MTQDATHDPGSAIAGARAPESSGEPVRLGGAEVRVGTASWTDKTMTAKGVFYPPGVSTPERRLRYYASRFPIVEADMGFYAIPDRAMTERWVERTPDDFVFNVKAHALMTGHATDVARLPRLIRDELPSDAPSRIYSKDLTPELRDEVWRLFADAMRPLAESNKLGVILLQFAPWVRPAKHTPTMIRRIRERLPDLPIAVEFRHPSWLDPKLRERLWSLLRETGMT